MCNNLSKTGEYVSAKQPKKEAESIEAGFFILKRKEDLVVQSCFPVFILSASYIRRYLVSQLWHLTFNISDP